MLYVSAVLGLLRLRSTGFDGKVSRKAAGKQVLSSCQPKHLRSGAELAPNPTLPSQGSQWGTRTAAAFIIQGHPVTHREHEMLRLSRVLLSPHLCPAVRRFSYSQTAALISLKSLLLHTNDPKMKKIHYKPGFKQMKLDGAL